jgi:hypothetical protein
MGDAAFHLTSNWLEVTALLPVEASELLLNLIRHAAGARSLTLAVDRRLLISLTGNLGQRARVRGWFDLLVKEEFVREVEPGQFLIAPGLWAFDDHPDSPDEPMEM